MKLWDRMRRELVIRRGKRERRQLAKLVAAREVRQAMEAWERLGHKTGPNQAGPIAAIAIDTYDDVMEKHR